MLKHVQRNQSRRHEQYVQTCGKLQWRHFDFYADLLEESPGNVQSQWNRSEPLLLGPGKMEC